MCELWIIGEANHRSSIGFRIALTRIGLQLGILSINGGQIRHRNAGDFPAAQEPLLRHIPLDSILLEDILVAWLVGFPHQVILLNSEPSEQATSINPRSIGALHYATIAVDSSISPT